MLTDADTFKKIETINDIELLYPGLIILKYPIAGNPTNKIDVQGKNHIEYEVSLIEERYLVLIAPGYLANSAPLAKEFERLIKDGKWWYKTN